MSPLILGIMASSQPGATNSYESIATVTVGAGGQSTVTFSSIPATYKHLQIRLFAKYTGVGYGLMRFNGDSGNNYSAHGINGNGVVSDPVGAFAFTNISSTYYTGAAGTKDTAFNVSIIDILDYANTNKNKTVKGLYGWDNNGTGYVEFNSGNWRNTNAITDIVLRSSAGNFSQYSSIALYGIKG
jgi:hypothetical protein